MIWHNLVENFVFVAAIPDYVQTVIYLVRFVCGPIVLHAAKVVPVQLVNVGVVWGVLEKPDYHYCL